MQIVFDRYEPCGGARHVDLATGALVDVITWSVPDEDWRRRWRLRVDALIEGGEGLEPLIDAGDAGAHGVFEVRTAAGAGRAGPRDPRTPAARLAVARLESRGLSAGPCRVDRLTADGRLCADAQTAWPVETAAEWRAARASWRAWGRLLGGPVPPATRVRDRQARGAPAGYADDACDNRAGLVELPVDAGEALAFARASGRVAVDSMLDPSTIVPGLMGRSCVLLGGARAACAGWSRALAAAGAQRHFYVPARRPLPAARERAPAYAPAAPRALHAGRRAHALTVKAARALETGRLAEAARLGGRAALVASGSQRAQALVIKARALRLGGRAVAAASLLDAALRAADQAAGCALLVEAAEAATDAACLQQGEAFARAALFAAASAPEQAAAQSALDRARVWRGGAAASPLWQARAAWHVWGRAPAWPARGAYPHAPAGPLARWEAACDALERARWRGDDRAAARIGARLIRARGRLPPLLRARAEWLTTGTPDRARRLGAHAVLHTGKAGKVMEIFEHMSALLAACHDAQGESALTAAAARTRDALAARSVAVYAAGRALPVAGDGAGWNAASDLAARGLAAAAPAGPERAASGLGAVVPMRAGGRLAGALLAMWPSHAAVDERRARLLLEAAALVTAPVLGAWCDRAEPAPCRDMPEIVGSSAAIQAVRDAVRRVARVPFPVLIEGESGAGKELVARAVHRLSPRASKPFRALNCAAMAEELVEAELFGHAQGAFTGAMAARPGLFEDADRGTLFLDEVSELSPRAQAKLLRVLQEAEVRRVGETAPRRVDVRIVAASNRPLGAAVESRAFRADLSFRLDVLRIVVPPLRERPEDIALLAAHFWREAADRAGTSATLAPDVMGCLAGYAWPGNVRELQNVMAALAVSAPRRGRVSAACLPPHIGATAARPITLQQARATLERDLVRVALARAGGRPGRAAAELGVSRQGLAKLMRRLGLPAA